MMYGDNRICLAVKTGYHHRLAADFQISLPRPGRHIGGEVAHFFGCVSVSLANGICLAVFSHVKVPVFFCRQFVFLPHFFANTHFPGIASMKPVHRKVMIGVPRPGRHLGGDMGGGEVAGLRRQSLGPIVFLHVPGMARMARAGAILGIHEGGILQSLFEVCQVFRVFGFRLGCFKGVPLGVFAAPIANPPRFKLGENGFAGGEFGVDGGESVGFHGVGFGLSCRDFTRFSRKHLSAAVGATSSVTHCRSNCVLFGFFNIVAKRQIWLVPQLFDAYGRNTPTANIVRVFGCNVNQVPVP